MVDSYKKIDYRVRPAKHAERLMMCDALRRLKFGSIETYQYVGMGSVYFSDFILFHRALGITDMVSIEASSEGQHEKKRRFTDNLPFSNITLKWGFTATELPTVDLTRRTIAWLDYDGRLCRSILDDVRLFSQRAVSGSVLIVSAQCNAFSVDGSNARKQISDLENDLGPEYLQPDLTDDDLQGWGMAQVSRAALCNMVEQTLSLKNGTLPLSQRMNATQIFYFHYKDGSRMVTAGWVFYDRGQRAHFDQCDFDGLEFVRTGDKAFTIDIPLLTLSEIKKIDRQMPIQPGSTLDFGSMPKAEAEKYAALYRYFPNFATVDF